MAQIIKSLPAMPETGFDPWVWKIPWRREWLPTLFLPVKSHGQRSLVGCGPWYCEELDTSEPLTHTHISLEALSPYRYMGVRTPICEFRCMGEHRFSVCNR